MEEPAEDQVPSSSPVGFRVAMFVVRALDFESQTAALDMLVPWLFLALESGAIMPTY